MERGEEGRRGGEMRDERQRVERGANHGEKGRGEKRKGWCDKGEERREREEKVEERRGGETHRTTQLWRRTAKERGEQSRTREKGK